MYTMMESYYKPNMTPLEVENTLAEVITAASDRDILSGLGAVVYVLTEEELKEVHLKTKMI